MYNTILSYMQAFYSKKQTVYVKKNNISNLWETPHIDCAGCLSYFHSHREVTGTTYTPFSHIAQRITGQFYK